MTKGGPITFVAESYAFHPRAGFLELEGPRLFDGAGRKIASASSVRATGINVLNLSKSALKVTINHAKGTMVRDADGQIDFTRYLPSTTTSNAPTPVQVSIEDASVEVVDESGPSPWLRAVHLHDVQFAGLGPRWRAAAEASIEDAGNSFVSVRHEADSASDILASANDLELADLARHLLATLKPSQLPKEPISVQSLIASGPIEVQLPPDEGARFHFYGTLQARSLNYGSYHANTAELTGTVDRNGLGGKFAVEGSGVKATLNGAVAWAGQTMAEGSVAASATSLAALPDPIRKLIPKTIKASGLGFTGIAGYTPVRGSFADGRLTVGQASYEKDVATNLVGRVVADQKRVWAHLDRASIQGARLAGEGAVNPPSKSLSAYFRLGGITASALLNRFPNLKKSLAGKANGKFEAVAVLSGPMSGPKIDFRVAGDATYADSQLEKPFAISRVLALGEYDRGMLTLRRLRARTESGTISAFGQLEVKSRALNVTVDSRGLDISELTSKATGIASVSGVVHGTLDDPRFSGQADAYDLTYNGASVALATAQVAATLHEVAASNFEAVFGSSEVQGNVAVNVDTKGIAGEFHSKGLQLGDLLGDNFAGLVQLDSQSVGGTFDDPHIVAAMSGTDLLARDTALSSVNALASLDGRVLTLNKATVSAAGGVITSTGSYDLDSGDGQFAGDGSNLEIASILPRTESSSVPVTQVEPPAQGRLTDQRFTGTASGHFQANVTNQALAAFTANGQFKALTMNATGLGAGPWSVQKTGDAWRGSISGKGPAGSFSVSDGTYDDVTNALSATVDLGQFNIANLYTAVQPIISANAGGAATHLAFVEGALSTTAKLTGTLDNVNLDVPAFEATNLKYTGVDFGSLEATGSRIAGLWTLNSLSLTDGAMVARASGTIKEGGAADVHGDLANFDLTKLAAFVPETSHLAGQLSASFKATGTTKQPVVRASADVENVAVNGQRIDFGLDLDSIALAGGAIDAGGAISYRGFHGTIQGHIPFSFANLIPADAPIAVRLALAERPLTDIAPYLPAIDPARASGTVRGLISLTGFRDALHLSGGISVSAPRVGFRMATPGKSAYEPIATELRDLVASVDVQDRNVSMDIAAKSSQGGAIDAQMASSVDALQQLLTDHTVADSDAWLSSAVTGKVGFSDVVVKERNSVFDTSFGLAGALDISGPLASPRIRSVGDDGALALSNLKTTLPSLGPQERAQGTEPPIDPALDIHFALKNPGHVTTALAGIDLNGGGAITGTAFAPDVVANFAVVKGLLTLPGGRVVLEPGGTVQARYVSDDAGAPEAQVLVDLLGDSHVVALRTLDAAERYDVHLDVHGDLLQPDLVSLTATSDPPDLSQDQILAMLGRTDLLQALDSASSQAQGQKELTQFAISAALPSIFDPVTAKVAADLRLDALTVEYNFLGQTSIVAAKSLGHGFLLEAQRQISEPAPGQQFTFDYRLIYRPPFRSALARRITFFLGADEQNSWKLGFQYGVRF
jgi:hypothetical protein